MVNYMEHIPNYTQEKKLPKIQCPYCMSKDLEITSKSFNFNRGITGSIFVKIFGNLLSEENNIISIKCRHCRKQFDISTEFAKYL